MAQNVVHNGAVSNFAAVFAWTDEGWTGDEADLAEIMTIEDIADLMREAAVEVGSDVVLLLVEGGTWFAVVRLSGEGDPQVFLSDARVATTGDGTGFDRIAGLLYGHAGKEGKAAEAAEHSAGDPALLTDLGTDAETLIALAVRADAAGALSVVAEHAGLRDAYTRLR